MTVKLSIDSVSDNLQILEFTGPDVLTPADLVGLKLPTNANTKKGIVVSGRGPIWLYAYLVHECHIFPFVATNDPRLGFVVVQSHTPGVKPGDILPSGQ